MIAGLLSTLILIGVGVSLVDFLACVSDQFPET